LGVLVGYKCNFRCSHCLVSEKKQQELSESEILDLRALLASRRLESVLFIGGEPTLYVDTINRVLEGFSPGPGVLIAITTNGHFADTEERAVETLKSVHGLNFVQVSYDNYHKRFVKISNIRNLHAASKKLGMGFAVLVAILSPLDLVLLQELEAAGIAGGNVRVQGVHAMGAAAANHLEYSYPSFNPDVLSKKCPKDGAVVYICGEGYTVCCSHLAFERENADFVHPTVEGHIASKFYGLIDRFSFGELMSMVGMAAGELEPRHSYPCALCEEIFSRMRKNCPNLLR
jgi:hypothetical protein